MSDLSQKKALLIILDGFGVADDKSVSAVDKAEKPFFDYLISQYPSSRLSASGEDVGLPEGQFGNSEVGHLNIGAGRIVWQELSRINKSIRDRSFFSNKVLSEAFEKASSKNRIHFMGLFSDGGVHSHNNHLFALLQLAKEKGIDNAFVHAFTDGRDTSPNGGLTYWKELQQKIQEIGVGELASVVGRYYAMDRDNRWERTEKAYNLLIHGEGEKFSSPETVFQQSYEDGITDEFILPHQIESENYNRIKPGDVVLFYNIRGDRARQISRAFLEFDDVPFETENLDLHYVTFTSYDIVFDDFLHVAYPPATLDNTIGEYISKRNLRQLRIAETEKYPHVTYFFNGGLEKANPGEERIMVPSPKVATYDLQPEMSADIVADKLNEQLRTGTFQLCVVNFANPDMVGHTGDFDATVKAVEFVDKQLKNVVETATENNYQIVVISDHGNADRLRNSDGTAHTSHTTAPVPVIVISDKEIKTLRNGGILADVSPTLLKLMELPQPEEMTGKPLF